MSLEAAHAYSARRASELRARKYMRHIFGVKPDPKAKQKILGPEKLPPRKLGVTNDWNKPSHKVTPQTFRKRGQLNRKKGGYNRDRGIYTQPRYSESKIQST